MDLSAMEEKLKARKAMYSEMRIPTSEPEDPRVDRITRGSLRAIENVSSALRNRNQKFVRRIDAALDRLWHGTFGLCLSCRSEIELKRLEAIPESEFCLGCKEAKEDFIRRKKATGGSRFFEPLTRLPYESRHSYEQR